MKERVLAGIRGIVVAAMLVSPAAADCIGAACPPDRGGGGGGGSGGAAQWETLDAYLAHLRRNGQSDREWYRLRPDGLYELVTRRPPGEPPVTYTRDALAELLGFAP